MPYVIRKSFTFEAAHQLESAETAACHECVHGHSYKVELFIYHWALDCHEMVLDFGFLKEFKEEIMREWDHGLLLHVNKRVHFLPLIEAGVLKKEKVWFFDRNPTAEMMASHIHDRLVLFLKASGWTATARKVRVHETSTGWAEYFPEASLKRTEITLNIPPKG